ncbi:hypothetical protein [Mycoplasma putrefaciens]|uniref:Uncharacterized protein n=1 Tax=Mycoplasma putrefaciens (strain ATCC 15718 / NCTC 10155 / C30 KS-1 / KS-1) TaxID=743965 RepID=A0A7U4E9L2_MYCPK|nr:hypothetical protein [Mycoplasma putrefaciens]AEM68967.1 uncharacterized protein MPUT_0627 [Mycoplasma putrefaciens KS1]
MKTSAKYGVFSAFVGVLISLTNMLIQFLMIFWILKTFGTEINGFIRISMSLSLIAGTSEGALAIATIVMLMRPLSEGDWISANEIFSTAKRRYNNNIISGFTLILVLSILYPLEIALAPTIIGGEPAKWSLEFLSPSGNKTSLRFWELSLIFFIFGFKECLSSGLFGVYENILSADQRNGTRRLVILFSDILIYGLFFVGLNHYLTIGDSFSPVYIFLIFLIYPFIRGFLIKQYVRLKYPWLKFYSDFNNSHLVRRSYKIFWSEIGMSILGKTDILIIFLALGASALKATSLLSLYMVVGVNVRILMSTLITSFREYFLSIIIKNGRLDWNSYINYELYTYVVAALSFAMISMLTPFIVSGLFGSIVLKDNLLPADRANIEFIFTKFTFSVIFALTTAINIILEGKFSLVQAKGMNKAIGKGINVIALVYLIVSFSITLIVAKSLATTNTMRVPTVLVVFYVFKIIFLLIAYLYLWIFTWDKLVYVAKFNSIIQNLIYLLIALLIPYLVTIFVIQKFVPINLNTNVIVSFSDLLKVLSSSLLLALIIVIFLPLIIRPSVGVSLFLGLPIIKQIVKKQQDDNKVKRFIAEGIDTSKMLEQQELLIKVMSEYSNYDDEVIDQKDFKYLKHKEKPKIYTLKNTDLDPDQEKEIDSDF